MTTIAFDVDGCLIYLTGKKEDTPRYKIIQLFFIFFVAEDPILKDVDECDK